MRNKGYKPNAEVWVDGTQTMSRSYNAAKQVQGWMYNAAGNLVGDSTQQQTRTR